MVIQWFFRGLLALFITASLASCCCLGGSDDHDQLDPDEIILPFHNQGAGGV